MVSEADRREEPVRRSGLTPSLGCPAPRDNSAMVRHEAKATRKPRGRGEAVACCACPTGESPVPVGVGAPGSRSQVVEGDLRARAGRQEPVKRRESCIGEQARGPQQEVKPAASSDLQPAGRAAHVTAKATSLAQEPKRAGDCGGVWGAARVQGHLHKRMSGRLWQQKGLKRYYLQSWPSHKAMNRVRARVRGLTPRGRCHQDVRSVIAQLNPVMRGWGQYFQTGNAANHFLDVDAYVVGRLRSLRIKRAGRNLPAGRAQQWDRDYFERLGLHRLRGTIRYPGNAPVKGRSA